MYSVIENEIRSNLQRPAEEASAAFDVAQAELSRARNVLNNANSLLERGLEEVRHNQSAYDDAVSAVANQRNRLQNICSTRSCGTGKCVLINVRYHKFHDSYSDFIAVCTGCFDGTTCCGTAWGHCVCRRPRWNGCCHRVSDPTCEAQNAACEALREPIRLALRGAEALIDSTRQSLQVANAAISGLQQAVNEAERGVRVAQEAVNVVETNYAAGLQAAGLISRLGLGGLISIQEISFDVDLATAADGSFSGSVTAAFAGAAETTVSLHVNLHDITSMARQLVSHIGNHLSSLF